MFFDGLRRLFARGPLSAQAHHAEASPFEQAALALERGRYDDAIAGFTAVAATTENAAERCAAFNKRGVAQIACGRRGEALADFLCALDVEPAAPAALVNLGNLLLEEGAIEDAIDHYDAAVAADPTYAAAFRNRGIAHKRAGRFAASVRDLRAAVRLETRRAAARRSNSARA